MIRRKVLLLIVMLLVYMSVGCTVNDKDMVEEVNDIEISEKPTSTNTLNESEDEKQSYNFSNMNDGLSLATNILVAANDGKSNICVSGLSIKCALYNLYFLASGDTALEIKQVMGYEGLEDEMMKRYSQRVDGLQDIDSVTVNVANSLWLDDGFKYNADYIKEIQEFSDIYVEAVDMQSGSAEKQLNRWVSNETNEMVQGFYEKGDLLDATFVLLNAFYFKGDWTLPFMPHATAKDTFYGTTKESDVDFMNITETVLAYENDDYKAIRLGYGQYDRVGMYIFMPKEDMGSYTKIGDMGLNFKLDAFVEKEDAIISIPKFEIESDIDLVSILKQLGMEKVFTSQADFSNFTDEELYITDARHVTKIRVDEAGTEASAVTEFAAREICLEEDIEPFEFILNKPFVFLIRDDETGLIFFSGIVNNLE